MNNKEAIKYGIEWLEDEYLDAGDRAFIELALEALKQMPVTTTAGEGGVIYYPQVEGVTPTVIDVGKQEPCEMTAEEYRQRMIQAFHNADTDELIAVCVLPTEKEFEHLEWLLKNHYKKEPCGDAIDRAKAIKIASGYCHPANVAKELAKLPPVNPQLCEDAISRQAVLDLIVANHTELNGVNVVMYSPLYKDIKQLPPVTPQQKTGYWIKKDGYSDCSECGSHIVTEWDYCPKCSAKMDEPQERSDKCSKCEYYINPDYTRCKECGAERSDKE